MTFEGLLAQAHAHGLTALETTVVSVSLDMAVCQCVAALPMAACSAILAMPARIM